MTSQHVVVNVNAKKQNGKQNAKRNNGTECKNITITCNTSRFQDSVFICQVALSRRQLVNLSVIRTSQIWGRVTIFRV